MKGLHPICQLITVAIAFSACSTTAASSFSVRMEPDESVGDLAVKVRMSNPTSSVVCTNLAFPKHSDNFWKAFWVLQENGDESVPPLKAKYSADYFLELEEIRSELFTVQAGETQEVKFNPSKYFEVNDRAKSFIEINVSEIDCETLETTRTHGSGIPITPK